MKIGVIGAASVGWTLATKLATNGHSVEIANSRGADSLVHRVAEAGVPLKPVELDEALRNDLILLAVPWTKVREVLTREIDWTDKIVVDATNIFMSYAPDFQIADLGSESGSEIIARLIPAARVVKAFNTLPIDKMFAPLPKNGMKRVLFIAGDHDRAIHGVISIVEDLGLAPISIGTLATAGRQMELGGPFSALELFRPVESLPPVTRVP